MARDAESLLQLVPGETFAVAVVVPVHDLLDVLDVEHGSLMAGQSVGILDKVQLTLYTKKATAITVMLVTWRRTSSGKDNSRRTRNNLKHI